MRKDEVNKILRKKYLAYGDQVIAGIRELPPDCCQLGEDFGLADVWEEFKYQVQGEEAPFFETYVETIEALCRSVLEKLPEPELELLWLDSDAYFDKDDGTKTPDPSELMEGVVQELYQKVLNRAANEDLRFDPDEKRQRAAFDDDRELHWKCTGDNED